MSGLRFAGPVLLALGVVLIVAAVATGSAGLVVVVVFPVFVGGASALFLGGVAALFLGIFLLPLAFDFELVAPPNAPEAPRSASSGGSGGLILLGPFPLFFGSWSHPTRRTYWAAVVVGAAVLVTAVALSLVLR
jgi:uncharacterized membrane protein